MYEVFRVLITNLKSKNVFGLIASCREVVKYLKKIKRDFIPDFFTLMVNDKVSLVKNFQERFGVNGWAGIVGNRWKHEQ